MHASHIRGMLLEEAVLELLRRTGFAVIELAGSDPTLVGDPPSDGQPASLFVRGRGANHQIDAIGDFPLTMPFSHPGRLIVEAKCFRNKKVDLKVVRSTNGVLRDISEFFVPDDTVQGKRFHYHAAIFSATNFTKDAQRYAYAHDIFIVPLARNAAFKPIVEAIYTITSAREFRQREQTLSGLRQVARASLRTALPPGNEDSQYRRALSSIGETVGTLGESYLARTTSGFPLFLTPTSDRAVELASSGRRQRIRVHFSESEGWWLSSHSAGSEQRLFTFDLPDELFSVYDEQGRFNRRAASDMKQLEFDEIVAFRIVDRRVEMLAMTLDNTWLNEVRRGRRR